MPQVFSFIRLQIIVADGDMFDRHFGDDLTALGNEPIAPHV
jgi:hypothetical protein